jgi:hypothetical protein
MPLFPDDELEDALRTVAGLPEKPEGDGPEVVPVPDVTEDGVELDVNGEPIAAEPGAVPPELAG